MAVPLSSLESLPVAILGAGLTGLNAARALAAAGRSAAVFDGGNAVGGVIRSELDPAGWLIEAGPNSLQETPAVAALVRELGLASARQVASSAAKNRYIVREGKLRPLPLSPPGFLRSGVFSVGTKLRLAREFFYPKGTRLNDLPLADFFQQHFGAELLAYALDPFVSGIYAGDAARLSARHAFPSLWKAEQTHGSLIRAQIANARARRARGEPPGPPSIISFTEGLASLPRALAAALPAGTVRLGKVVRQLSLTPSGWTIDAAPEERFGQVILALPGPALARLQIGPPGETMAVLSALAKQEHPPVTSLFLGYRREDVAHPLDGFGVLLPSIERRLPLGVLFNSTLFPGRAPAGHVALTVMLGGARNPRLAGEALEDQLPLVQKELASLLGVRGAPVLVRRTHWPHAIPQYLLDHEIHLQGLADAEQRYPGLHIGGPVRDGIGLPACLAAGRRLATAALGLSSPAGE